MEMAVLYAIQSLRTDFLDTAMVFISRLGNSGIIWIIAGLVMICLKKYRKSGVAVIIALVLCLILGNGILKNIVARSRPCWIDDSIKLLIDIPKDYSFPSGHTFSSFAAAISIAYFHKNLGAISFILAILIAFSRIYLFVHYPSDILGGIALGCVAAISGIILVNRIYKK